MLAVLATLSSIAWFVGTSTLPRLFVYRIVGRKRDQKKKAVVGLLDQFDAGVCLPGARGRGRLELVGCVSISNTAS
jgi:hypothetical protein